MRVEPGLVSVKDLLLKAHSGDWSFWLPSFQRRFVWDPVDIKAFFDSLLKGNPVGILLLWRSKNPEDSDPFALKVLVGGGKSSENYLIVDGQQRILSLLFLLNGGVLGSATFSSGWNIPHNRSRSTPRSTSLRLAGGALTSLRV
jgi:hypothetical protein